MAIQIIYERTRSDGVEIEYIYSDSIPKRQIQSVLNNTVYTSGELYSIKNKYRTEDFIELDELVVESDSIE